MMSASVTMRPSKPSCWRSSHCSISRESVAGTPAGSSAGKATCAVMIDATPASIAARNGTRSVWNSVSWSVSTVGSASCESTVVRPCPGKCFAQASTPSAWQASIHSVARAATVAGSEPSDRVPTIGFSGRTSRSHTGA